MEEIPYRFPLENYMSEERFERIKAFGKDKETPFLVIDLDIIKANYDALRASLPYAKIYYAVKANPHDEVVGLLRDLGSNFDVATRFELDQLLRLGVSPNRLSFGNTIKKERDIAYFYEKGVRLFVTDSPSDLDKIARAAPGSRVFFRLLTEGLGADWPLSKKFGSHPDLARQLVKLSVRLGLEPYGISFHPGSQQRDVGAWSSALTTVGQLFRWAREEAKVDLKMINMGGGFPADYVRPPTPSPSTPRTSATSSTTASRASGPRRSSSSPATRWPATPASSSPRSSTSPQVRPRALSLGLPRHRQVRRPHRDPRRSHQVPHPIRGLGQGARGDHRRPRLRQHGHPLREVDLHYAPTPPRSATGSTSSRREPTRRATARSTSTGFLPWPRIY